MQTMKIAETANVTDSKGVFLFGGKAAGRKAAKKELVPVKVELHPRGIVKLIHAETAEEVLHSRTGTVIFAGPVSGQPAEAEAKPKRPRKKAVKAPEAAEKPQVEEKPQAPAKRPGKAPKNFIELARSGNTEAARAYWSRRVAEYEG
jgi:hypothetical protein